MSCRRTALPRGPCGSERPNASPEGQASVLCRRFQPSLRHAATSTREQLVQRGLVSMLNSGKDWGIKIRSFLVVRWGRTGARAPWP